MIDCGRYEAFGSVFSVQADEPLAGELIGSLADLRSQSTGGRPSNVLNVRCGNGEWTVRWNQHGRYRGPELSTALYDALIAINMHAARTAAASGHTVLHGGAVDVSEHAIAFVGHSGAGKSTLTTAMSRAGHYFLADEVVAIDENSMVQSFHRPIGLRSGGATALGIALPEGPYDSIHPYRVGTNHRLGTPTPLAAVLLLKRYAAAASRLVPITPATALFELTNQTLGATDLERAMFRRLDTLVRRIPVAELHYTEPADAIALAERAATEPPTQWTRS